MCRQVIKRHILAALPEVFGLTIVIGFDDQELKHIASEPQRLKEQRIALFTLAQGLIDSLTDCVLDW